MASLALCGLEKKVDREILRGVHLEAPAGQVTVVLGSSGAGKTTILRLVAGLDRPDRGIIRIGADVLDDAAVHVEPHRRGLGFVFQEPALPDPLTPTETVEMVVPGRAARALDAAGLQEGLRHTPNGRLSGGERRRVSLARALAVEPRVLLLDEPFGDIEESRRNALWRLIRELAESRGVAVLAVTHMRDEAFLAADRLAILCDGRIAQQGTPRECYEMPETLDVARLTGPVLHLAGRVMDGQVVTDVGRLHAPEGAADGPVDVAMRPEHVVAAESGTGLRGCALGRVFTGPQGEVAAMDVGGCLVHVAMEADPGTEVCLTCPAARIRVFRRQ